jgi:serine/threonine protein kinase/tetratricopeptide (TPR) repeat protein
MTTLTSAIINNRFKIRNDSGRDLIIGQGGMGTVYHGMDTFTQQPVAIKLLRNELTARDPEMLQRFIREGEALRQLNHPNIVKMLDAVDVEGEHYLIMEYVTGGSLRDVLEKNSRLTVQRALYIALDLADALTRAHRLNILHRDIKPDNVLVAEDGTPRLTDFGMARFGDKPHITQDGAIVGTLAYMAPELFSGVASDEKTDIWSFGVMLYEMLAGKRPFDYDQPGALINAILTQSVSDLESHRPDVPIALVDLVYRMLAKDPVARIASVRLVGAELDAILRGDGKIVLPTAVEIEDKRFETPTPLPTSRVQHRLAPNNLPAQATAFVGRERELNDIQKLLADPANRLVTLLGTGGIGKTRLSLAIGKEQLSHFHDGVFFVSLAAIESQNFITSAIADAIDFNGDRDNLAGIIDFFRDKNILLLMDNFEHVSGGANLLNDILQAAPQVKILATSRERLRLRGETIYEVDNLAVPKPHETSAEDINAYACVQLFTQSARRVMPNFEVDDQNSAAVAQIMRLVQGLPLGVELAAAWVEMLPLDEIAGEIEKSLDFLETDLRDVPERHRSLRAVFEYSWNLMTADEQDIFVKLSIFRGGFERDAADKVAGASLRVLTGLVNKSLVQRDGSGRYYVHKLLRQYAEEHADATAKATAHMQHAKYYGMYLTELTKALNSSKEGAAMDAIETELENLRLAWHSAIASQHYEALEGVLDTLTSFYLGRSMIREGMELFKQLTDALVMCGKSDTDLYWQAISRKCWLASRIGLNDVVLREAKKAYEYFKSKDNPVEMAIALNQMSYASMMHSDYPRSLQYAEEAIELMQDIQDTATWFMAMGNYGYAQFLAGNLIDARYTYESILHTLQNYETSPSAIGYYKNNLGEILRNIGEGKEALRLFKEAYDIFKSEKNLRGMAFTTNNIAGLNFSSGDLKQASAMYEEAYRIYKEIGDRYGLGHSLSALGNIAQGQGDQHKAIDYYEKSLGIRRDIGDKRGVADSLMDLALTALNIGEYQLARRYADEAIGIRRDIGDPQGLLDAMLGKALGLLSLGELAEAEQLAQEALASGEKMDYGFALVQSKIVLGQIAQLHKNYDQAMQYYMESMQLGLYTDYLGISMISMVGIAEIREIRGDLEGALRIVGVRERYPSGFVATMEKRLTALGERLRNTLNRETVTSTITLMRDVDVRQFINDLIDGKQ